MTIKLDYCATIRQNKLEIVMIRIIAALSIAMLCTNANANVGIDEYCFEAMKLSEAVMKARQYGVSIESALSVRESAFKKSKDEAARLIHTEMILEAYDGPMYSTEKYKQSEIKEFAAENYLACIKGMRLATDK